MKRVKPGNFIYQPTGKHTGTDILFPETAYSGQYKLNGNPVKLNTEYISQSKYMEQKANSNVLLFHTPEGTKT